MPPFPKGGQTLNGFIVSFWDKSFRILCRGSEFRIHVEYASIKNQLLCQLVLDHVKVLCLFSRQWQVRKDHTIHIHRSQITFTTRVLELISHQFQLELRSCNSKLRALFMQDFSKSVWITWELLLKLARLIQSESPDWKSENLYFYWVAKMVKYILNQNVSIPFGIKFSF